MCERSWLSPDSDILLESHRCGCQGSGVWLYSCFGLNVWKLCEWEFVMVQLSHKRLCQGTCGSSLDYTDGARGGFPIIYRFGCVGRVLVRNCSWLSQVSGDWTRWPCGVYRTTMLMVLGRKFPYINIYILILVVYKEFRGAYSFLTVSSRVCSRLSRIYRIKVN